MSLNNLIHISIIREHIIKIYLFQIKANKGCQALTPGSKKRIAPNSLVHMK